MTKPQAIVLLKTIGFSDILRIEKDRSFWRAMAIKDHATYHVVINRYTGLVAHMDKKSREQYPVASKVDVPTVMKPGKRKMLSTLNGPIAATISSPLKSSQPVSTVMGEVGWTWMKEKHAKLILKSKGYTNIIGLKRDAKGIWRAKAVRRGLALNAAVDNYGNVEAQPEGQGGLSQGSPSY